MVASPARAELKIGVVDYGRLVEESPQAKAALDSIRNEFTPRQRDLQNQQASLKSKEDKLNKDGATMTPDQRECPFPLYARAREDMPVFYSERFDLWVVTRYADIVAILKDPVRFSSGQSLAVDTGVAPQVQAVHHRMVIFEIPPYRVLPC